VLETKLTCVSVTGKLLAKSLAPFGSLLLPNGLNRWRF